MENFKIAHSTLIYERRDGIDSDHGVCFEWQTTNLAYLRCEKLHRQWVQDNTSGVKSYIVANNVDGIGAFDDVVIRAEYPHQNEDKTKLIFVQCKYFSNPKKCLLEKVLKCAMVQKYFDSFMEVLRILNDHRALSCQTYNEIKIHKYTKRPRPQETAKNTEKENKLRSFFQCKPKDCEFIFYSNMILDSGFENTQTQQDNDISMKILNTARINVFNVSLNAEQLEYLPNEQFVNEKEIFEELKQEFATKFRIIVNQVDNVNVELLKSIIPTADISGIYPLLEEEVKCYFQNIPSTAITESSELLENIENFSKLKTIAKNELESFLHISEHGNLFLNESIENLQNQFDNEEQTKICTSSIKLEKLKLKQYFTNKVQESKLLVFIKDENDLRIWTKARKSRLYRNFDHFFVCLENMNMLSGYAKDTNEVFIEIHQNNENDSSFYFAQFSHETSKLILNHAIIFQGYTVTVNDICGDEWRRLLDEKTTCKILRGEEIVIGSKFFDSLDCYMERKLQLKEKNEENSYRVNQLQIMDKYGKSDTKNLTEDDIIEEENKDVFLLTGPAGIGKSTTLKSLALKYKNQNPKYFVYLIELNKYFNVLKKYKEDCDVAGAIEFLAQKILSLQQLEYRLFVYACAEKKNVALFFDGFDEISPDGENIFSTFLQTLLKAHISRIFVSSRPNCIGTLEEILLQDSIIFLPFTSEEKKNFFMKYYEKLNKENDITNEKEEIDHFISRILKSIEEKIGKLDELLEIPLQIIMLAEVYFEKISGMTTEEKMSISIKMDICSLYNAFIDKLVERYLVEKRNYIMQEKEKNIEIRDKMRGAAELACKLIFPDINQTPLAEYSDAIVKMSNQVGIITNIDPPVFLHRTYGEFLAANWFVHCIMNEKKNSSAYISYLCKNVLIEKQYREIRKFINALLCNFNSGENDSNLVKPNGKIFIFCEYGTTSLHTAAKEKYTQIVKLFVQNDPSKINERDRFEATALLTACKYGDFKSVEILVSNNCIINIKDIFQRNALHHIAYGGNADIINYILEKDPTLLRKTDDFGNTALNLACRFNTTEIVMCLLQIDRDLADIADKLGNLPLHYATENGNIQIVKEILNYNSNLINNECHDGLFPLHIACKKNHIEVAKYLLTKKKSLVNVKCGKKEETTLHFAARNGNLKLLTLLLQHDPTLLNKCNSDGDSPLLCALRKKQNAAAKYLLKFPNCVLNTGDNPLTLAAEIGDVDILRTIYNLDSNLLNKVGERNCRGRTPLLCALKASNIEAAKFLLEIAECLLTVDLDTKSPLHYAAINGNKEIIKLIIKKDRSLLLKQDKIGRSALYFAIDRGQTEVARSLLSCDEYFVEGNILQNELQSAIRNNNFEIMTLMLKRNSTLINRRNSQELLPLDIACRYDNTEAAKYLLTLTDSALVLKGEKSKSILHDAARSSNLIITKLILEKFPLVINQRDAYGRTALHYACQYYHTEVAKLLLDHHDCQIDVYDYEKQNPLHLALENFNIEVMKMILERDISLLNKKNKFGQTPLHLILDQHQCYGNFVSVAAEYLLNLNCLINKERVEGINPIHLASKKNEVKIVKLLIERDEALLNLPDGRGLTPLHHACKCRNNEAVRFLLHLPKCDIYLTDNEENTTLHHAAMDMYGNNSILSLLIQRDRSLLNKTNKMGQTALHLAATYSNAYALEYLLDQVECKANVQDKYGDTPLHSFIKGNNDFFFTEFFRSTSRERKILSFAKLDSSQLNIKNNYGQTPLHMAVEKNESCIVDFLVRSKADVHMKDNESLTPLDLALKIRTTSVKSLDQSIIDILQKDTI